MKILVINGPNINMLGIREPGVYGRQTFQDLLDLLKNTAHQHSVIVDQYQSNHEGAIVDKIQEAYGNYDGIVINPAGYTHTSVSILDALKAVYNVNDEDRDMDAIDAAVKALQEESWKISAKNYRPEDGQTTINPEDFAKNFTGGGQD